jgi:alpha-N-acetylglucosamine transferase
MPGIEPGTSVSVARNTEHYTTEVVTIVITIIIILMLIYNKRIFIYRKSTEAAAG